jgi:DNA repair protein RecN (Recombination protein N)
VLQRLTIRGFALIDEIDLEFHSGMTVLLGETGAGKSIIIDALAAAMGARVSSENVRQGARKAVIEALFDLSSRPAALEFIRQHELNWDSDQLVLRREIPSSGASRCFVNDTPAQASIVRELATLLIDVHGQHDTHGLLSTASHLAAFDAYALPLGDDRRVMASAWQELAESRRKRDALERRILDADADRARLTFIHDEIASVAPAPDEDRLVSAELRRIESGEHVVGLATDVRDRLYSGDHSAYDQIRLSIEAARQLGQYDPSFESFVADLESALITCKEVAASASALADADDYDLARLEELRQRFTSLQRLIRKYGSLASAIDKLEEISQDLHDVENLDELLQDATDLVLRRETSALEHANRISQQRHAASASFGTTVQESLREMGMPSARFVVDIIRTDLGSTGFDAVEFLFSANDGDVPKPLARIASGGELSRVMLALKQTLLQRMPAGTVVLDEIDTGISGRVARTVGHVMQQISTTQQVICITHLAQIASLAQHFIRVTKTMTGGTTVVSARSIPHDEAQNDVAMLLSGSDISDAALESARELMGRPATKAKRITKSV